MAMLCADFEPVGKEEYCNHISVITNYRRNSKYLKASNIFAKLRSFTKSQ